MRYSPFQGHLAFEQYEADTRNPQQILWLRSFSGDEWYRISIAEKICDCPNFNGRCEHLDALGIHRLRHFTPPLYPTFSQALSGLVKSLRIRRVEDAVYWLVYLDDFKGPQFRFRTARRLLIGSAEDGHTQSSHPLVRLPIHPIQRA
jgi:hypothetical protein